VRVLSLSYCFPTPSRPAWGVFVQQRLEAQARCMELEVAAPVPTFPLLTGLRGGAAPARHRLGGLTVHRPRFFCVPGVLKWLDGRFYAWGLRPWLREYCRGGRPDLLDAHFIWPDGVGAAYLSRWSGIPFVVTLRGWLYQAMSMPRILQQCTAALRRAAGVIAVSGHLARTAMELGAPPERTCVIPNGVDKRRFRPRDKAAARRELALGEQGRLLVTVAHLGPRKGHQETLQALARLGDDVRLVLVGGDSEGNERRLRALTARLGLGARVIFAGRQPYERVPLYFAAADVCVLASHREGCPNVVLEALASGRPVVATSVGAVPDLITSPRLGRIVPPREPGALSEALAEALSCSWDPEHIAAAETVRTWDEVAKEVRDVFEGVLAGGAAEASP